MRKEEYMKCLAKRLKKLPKRDFDMAMEYFEEYFEEAGPDREEQAILDLGTSGNRGKTGKRGSGLSVRISGRFPGREILCEDLSSGESAAGESGSRQ